MWSRTGSSRTAAALAPALGMAASLAAGLTWSSAPASACGDPCEHGYGSAYNGGYGGPPIYAYAPPVSVYAAPPVYAYSYYGPAPNDRTYYNSYYTSRINIFRGPRWNYSAAYYSAPGGWGRPCRVHRRRVGVPPCYAPRPYRGYMVGPIIRASGRW